MAMITFSTSSGSATRAPATSATTAPTAAACPSAIGGSARHIADARPACIPSATANNQPMPGLIPWYAPRPIIVAQSMMVFRRAARQAALRIAVRVGRGVAALQPHLMRPHGRRLEEEPLVEGHPAV